MLTLNDLAATAGFGLTLAAAGGGAGDGEVDHALVLSDAEQGVEQRAELAGARIEHALVVAGHGLLGLPGHPDPLVRTLAAGGAAGLALAGAAADDPRLAPLRAAADAAGLPLLTSTRPPAAWHELAPRVAELNADRVRRLHARLAGLLDRLPAPGTDERVTVRRLTSFLAEQLDADVVVYTREGVLAAAPATAPAALGSAVGTPGGSQVRTARGRFAQAFPLSGAGGATLVVGTRQPVAATDQALAVYTARALTLALSGLRERRAEQTVGEAVRGVRLSAFQLLMTGNTVPAQRVMAGISDGLLDSDTAQVFIVDCAHAGRDRVMAEAESALADQALTVRCPAHHGHIIVVAPHHPHTRPEKGLHRLLDTFSEARVLLGGSLTHPLEEVADAYGEALDSLARAGHSPDRVAMATRTTGIVDVLGPGAARAWASHLLHPVLAMPREGREVLQTTAMALEFEISAAARIIGVHRNTVARRVRQVFDAVGLDHDRILDRVVVSLAAQIAARHGADRVQDPAAAPDLHDLLSQPALRAWADKVLRPLAGDRRDLQRTVRAWVRHGCRFEEAAASLGIAVKTVRSHIHAAERLLERDLVTGLPEDAPDGSGHRLASIRPLAVALYATAATDSARPPLPGGRG